MRAAALLVLVLVAGCAPMQPLPPLESVTSPKLGELEDAYDRANWRWVKNPDGRALLTHAQIERCFVDPQPEPDTYADPGFTVKRDQKTIGNTRYDVANVYEQRQFWESAYSRAGSARPLLVVYAEGRCRQEAERILEAYEKTRGP